MITACANQMDPLPAGGKVVAYRVRSLDGCGFGWIFTTATDGVARLVKRILFSELGEKPRPERVLRDL